MYEVTFALIFIWKVVLLVYLATANRVVDFSRRQERTSVRDSQTECMHAATLVTCVSSRLGGFGGRLEGWISFGERRVGRKAEVL